MNNNIWTKIKELSIFTIIADIGKNILFIILACLIAFMASMIYSRQSAISNYQTSVIIRVNSKVSPTALEQIRSRDESKNRTSELRKLFAGNILINTIAQKGEFDLGDAGSYKVVAKVLGKGNLVKVDVRSSSPAKSYRLMNELLKAYPEVFEYSYHDTLTEIVQGPNFPQDISTLKTLVSKQYTGIYAAGAVSVLLIVILSLLRSTVKNVTIAENQLLSGNFGTVPYENKNKTFKMKRKKTNKLPLITNATASYAFTDSYNQIAVKVEEKKKETGLTTLLLTSCAANEGKSVTAFNLAHKLAQRKQKVAILDCNLEKTAFYHSYGNDKVAILGLAESVGNAQSVSLSMKVEKLTEVLAKARQEYDIVLIDGPSVGEESEALLASGLFDGALMVVRRDFSRVMYINDALQEIDNSNTELLGYVFNCSRELQLGSIVNAVTRLMAEEAVEE